MMRRDDMALAERRGGRADLGNGDEDLDIPTKRTGARSLSRRTLLLSAAGFATASRAAAGRGKRSQAEVAYQDHPHGAERCEICAPFLPPDQCRLVVGPVGRQGWCKVFTGPDEL
jgi:hypothetical protein